MSEQCPLRLVCNNNDTCRRSVIEFDLTGYPTATYEGRQQSLVDHPIDPLNGNIIGGVFPSPSAAADNGYANRWPLPLCDGSGAVDGAGNITEPEDRERINILETVIHNNTWPETLAEAVETTPNAVWAAAFTAEIDRRQRHDDRKVAVPCSDCTFAGDVRDISYANSEITDPQVMGGRIAVRFADGPHRTEEVVVVPDDRQRYPLDDEMAVSQVVNAVDHCGQRGEGPVTGALYALFGKKLGSATGCGALYDVSRRGVIQQKFSLRAADPPETVINSSDSA